MNSYIVFVVHMMRPPLDKQTQITILPNISLRKRSNGKRKSRKSIIIVCFSTFFWVLPLKRNLNYNGYLTIIFDEWTLFIVLLV